MLRERAGMNLAYTGRFGKLAGVVLGVVRSCIAAAVVVSSAAVVIAVDSAIGFSKLSAGICSGTRQFRGDGHAIFCPRRSRI